MNSLKKKNLIKDVHVHFLFLISSLCPLETGSGAVRHFPKKRPQGIFNDHLTHAKSSRALTVCKWFMIALSCPVRVFFLHIILPPPSPKICLMFSKTQCVACLVKIPFPAKYVLPLIAWQALHRLWCGDACVWLWASILLTSLMMCLDGNPSWQSSSRLETQVREILQQRLGFWIV